MNAPSDLDLQQIRDLVRKGDVVLVGNRKNIISKMIKWFTKSHYSHALLFVGKDDPEFGDDEIVEATAGGVQKNTLDHYDPKKYRYAIIRPFYHREEQEFMVWVLKGMLKHHYDYPLLIGYIIAWVAHKMGIYIKNPFGSDYSYACSEMVARALAIISPRFDVRPLAIAKDYDLVAPQTFVDACEKMSNEFIMVAYT